MTFKCFYLQFNSPLHLGNHRPNTYDQTEEYIRSDTLVAAIFSTWSIMGYPEWIPQNGDPGFTLSSAFPYVVQKETEVVHFFPRPKIKFINSKEDNRDNSIRKKIKKVRWLDQEYFEKILGNDSIQGFGEEDKDLQDQFLSYNLDIESHFIKDLMQRVAISREVEEHKDSDPFYMERLFFKDSGLFFLFEGDHFDRVLKALNFLQYEGLGTDRTVGNGLFELKIGEINLQLPTKTSFSTNLSLFSPLSAEDFREITNHEDVGFEAVRRGGWITTEKYLGKQKKSVLMFSEGGIWQTSKQIYGKSNIDLTPSSIPMEHKIWRSGRSIFLPVKLD